MRLYRALLHLYPSSFRREYGSELAALHARRLASAHGLPGRAAVLAAAAADVIANATALHWELLVQDLHYAVRTLARAPGFLATAVLVTAVGVGANTAAFSIADYVFLRPLPYADPGSLVTLWQRPPDYRLELSPPNFRDWKAMSHSFQAMGAYHGLEVNFLAGHEPDRLTGVAVTPELLPLLGVQPRIGRLFTAGEERPAAGGSVILSHGLWQRAFGGDPAVLGRSVLLDGTPYDVIGVMPSSFCFPSRRVAFWTLMPAVERLNEERDNYWFYGLGRLKPGVTVEQAQADLSVVAGTLARAYPDVNEKMGAAVVPLRDEYSNRSRALILALCGASLSVLLIACANLASLLIARSFGRRREIELRAALGAGRERLVRQLVTESLVVALAGGALGVLVAVGAVPVLARLIPTTLPVQGTPAVNATALAVAALLSLLTGIGFGVVPALRSSATNDFSALREGVRGGGLRGVRLRTALVVVEVAASVTLLVWSGLLIRAFNRIASVDPGFRVEGVLTARTALPRPKYARASAREQFFTRVLTDIRRLPGVRSAAYISFLPMTMGGGIFPVGLPGEPANISTGRVASLRYATPGFFGTLGVPLLAGRDIRETDTLDQPMVAVVSESFARHYWPGDDALGKRFDFAYTERTVVGVVGDVRVRGPEQSSEPQVYLPYRQVDDESFPFFTPKDLAIRTSLPTEAIAPAVRQIVASADPQQPVSNLRWFSEIVDDQTETRAVQMRVLGAFAAIALVLAGVGVHGLLSFVVSQRRHEIGVRMALGAEPGRIVRGIVTQSALLAAAGVVPGLALAYAGGRTLESLLAGVPPGDALTVAVAATVCLVMALGGSLVPAVRATRVLPASALRSE